MKFFVPVRKPRNGSSVHLERTYYSFYRMADSEESCHHIAEGGGRVVEVHTIFTWWAEARGSRPHRCRCPCLGSGEASEFCSFSKCLSLRIPSFLPSLCLNLSWQPLRSVYLKRFFAHYGAFLCADCTFHDAYLFWRFGTIAHVVEWHSSARYSDSRSVVRPTRLPCPVLGMP